MNLIVMLVLLGVGLYLLQLIPMDATIKRIIQVLVIVVAVLWALQMLGLWHGLPALR
jgi:hypothetical protein